MKRIAMTAVSCALAYSVQATTCDMPTSQNGWLEEQSDGVRVALRAVDAIRPSTFIEFELWVCASDGSLPSSVPSVRASMPAHGHGTNYDPTVELVAPGQYRVQGLNFHMQGQWQVEVSAPFENEFHGATLSLDVQP